MKKKLGLFLLTLMMAFAIAIPMQTKGVKAYAIYYVHLSTTEYWVLGYLEKTTHQYGDYKCVSGSPKKTGSTVKNTAGNFGAWTSKTTITYKCS